MAHHCSLDNAVIDLIPDDLDGWYIIDVGCGYGFWGLYLRMKKSGKFKLCGIDIFKRYIDIHKNMRVYDEVFNIDVRDIVSLNRARWDLIIVSELLEHLNTKEEGLELIYKLEKMCKRLMIITTPLGFMKTVGYDNNPYQIHSDKSVYYERDFKALGFKTKIVRMQPLSRPVRIVDWIWRKIRRRYATRKQLIAYKRMDVT